MRTNTLVILVAALALGLPARAATNNLATALQNGLFEEEANHNLPAAIQAYESVAAQFDKDRKLAATAVFRLGECYRKEGNTNAAAAQYQRVLRDFSDQPTLASLSRQTLAALGAVPPVVPDAAGPAQAESLALELELRALEKLPRDQLRIAVQQKFPNPVLTALMQQLTETEQKLAALRLDYGPQHAEVQRATALRDQIDQQIDAQVSGVIRGLEISRDTAAKAAQAGQETRSTAPGSVGDANTPGEAEEVKRIQALVRDSPDLINAKDHGSTLLQNAAAAGQLVVAQFLLANHAEVNVGAGSGSTPLHLAAGAGHKGMVELLLKNGANVRATDFHGETPLHRAAEHGFRSVAEVLLAHGADANARAPGGCTPLHLAAANGFKSMLELLMAQGADVNAVNASTSQFRSDKPDLTGTPLHIAAIRDDGAIANCLLTNRADAAALNPAGQTPLAVAAAHGSVQVATLLLAHGADVNWKDAQEVNRGWTPLHFAVVNNNIGMVELLLQHHADPNARIDSAARDWKGYTPLLMATERGYPKIVDLLLDFKADPNLPGDNLPPLFKALWNRDPDERRGMVAALLGHGANVEAKARIETSVGNAPPGLRPPSAKQVFTPLMVAVQARDKDLVALLLRHKADPNASDARGFTSLHHAAEQSTYPDTTPILDLLLKAGADVNVCAEDGSTALDIVNRAPRYSNSSSEAFAAVLREHGALVDIPDLQRIKVSRPRASFAHTLFTKGTDDWNRFTLLELLATEYRFLTDSPNGGSRKADRMYLLAINNNYALSFPDLAHVQIRHPGPDLKSRRDEPVDLAAFLKSSDCMKDVPLEWGDVVVIPERDHPLNEKWSGFTRTEMATLKTCLTRHVDVLIKGRKTTLTLAPEIDEPDYVVTESPFWLAPVLRNSNLLLASSDLSRVKVSRRDPVTGKDRVWVIDCRESQPAPDFWLRDGDQIEVLEKP